ncbi:MAG: NAD(P)/FAD-dependent oxidoreductase [Pseudobdellovibrionaceae bacterium]
MAKIISNIQVPIDSELHEHLQWMIPDHGEYRVLKKSLDARRRHDVHFVYSLEVAEQNEKLERPQIHLDQITQPQGQNNKPIVIGSGPAGLFAALRLVERGIPCRLFERGSKSEKRILGINQFWRYGKLDSRNNVCYGEGGAGLYSDGKLITRIKSPHIPYVLNRLVNFGAPAEIEYLSNPHVGSDRIRRVIPKLREFLISKGCEIFFDHQITEFVFQNKAVTGVVDEYGKTHDADHVVLATGHSAEDMLFRLHDQGVFLEGKSFAMGLRVEHPQQLINEIQYRQHANHPKLGSANYKLTHHDHRSGIGVYSFCMCPGGFVLSSGTEADRIVCNGMSNYARNSPYANAAIVISIDHQKNFGNDLFGGLKLREELEKKAFHQVGILGGTKQLPAQNLIDFLESGNKNKYDLVKGSSPSGTVNVQFQNILPNFMLQKIQESFQQFNQSMKGFISKDAQLYGVESRTSCPIRVTRDQVTMESISHRGLYPCGEGAGYAGGITSAACDGVDIADQIYAKWSSQGLHRG